MNELSKLILGIISVVVASYSKILILLPILFVFYSIYLLIKDNLKTRKLPYRFFCFLLAMSIIDRYDISYGIINIFYISLLIFLIYQFFVIYLSSGSLNLIWFYFLMLSLKRYKYFFSWYWAWSVACNSWIYSLLKCIWFRYGISCSKTNGSKF